MKRYLRPALMAVAFLCVVLPVAILTQLFDADSSAGLQLNVKSRLGIKSGSMLPEQQSKDVTAEAHQLYNQVWRYVKRNFLWQDRLKDWGDWEHKYDGKFETFADAEKAVKEMLSSLGDDYTFFQDADATTAAEKRTGTRKVVSQALLPNDIGYIKIKSFSSIHTSQEVLNALKALKDTKALVLDLRDNPGGFVWQAVEVFALFADSGTFTTLKGRSNGAAYTEEYVVIKDAINEIVDGETTERARPDNYSGNKPVIVLVNQGTASAAEMLAGAMRDSKRAKIVGVKTYGKGIAQTTYKLARGTSFQVTYAEYYFPNGESIHEKGLKPDATVEQSGKTDTQLESATEFLLTTLKELKTKAK